jgi:hypothetical protein
MMRILTSAIVLFVLHSSLSAADPLSWPQGYVPFSAVYNVDPFRGASPLPPGVYTGFNQIISGLTGTAAQSGDLSRYLESLPPIDDRELYANDPIELAPGVFFTDVLVSTIAEHQGNFGPDLGSFGPVYDPLSGLPFPDGIIPESRLFGTFAFLVGGDDPVSPVPSPVAFCLSLRKVSVPWA